MKTRECLYRSPNNKQEWINGLVVGEIKKGIVFRRKVYLVEVTNYNFIFDATTTEVREFEECDVSF